MLLCRYLVLSIVLQSAIGSVSAAAEGAADWSGKWSDPAERLTRIGDLTLSDHEVVIGKRVRYTVSRTGGFGADGELLKVASVDRTKDPFGCGSTSKVNFLIVRPIEAASSAEIVKAIEVIFYGGTTPPDPAKLDDDILVCGQHSFIRPK